MPEETYQITWIILNAAKNLKVGKHKIAEFLKGSKAKDVASLSSYQGYGGLLWYNIQTIIGFVEQLEQMGLIARKRMALDDYYSLLEISEAGKRVLDEKIKIELQIIKREKPIGIGDSEKTTLELFQNGKAIELIAKERNLAISTIYDHLYGLVVNDYISSSEFIPENIINQILAAKSKMSNDFKLKEIKEILPESVTYNEIKCVLSDKTIKIEDENIDKSEDEFWSEGYFAQSVNPDDAEKMRTFHMKHDEEMNFNCKKCDSKISAHNKDWHDGMCDDCFNKKYFPEDL